MQSIADVKLSYSRKCKYLGKIISLTNPLNFEAFKDENHDKMCFWGPFYDT